MRQCRLSRAEKVLREEGLEPRLMEASGANRRHLHLSVDAGDEVLGDWPEANAALADIQRIVKSFGCAAQFTGDGNDDSFDVWVGPRR